MSDRFYAFAAVAEVATALVIHLIIGYHTAQYVYYLEIFLFIVLVLSGADLGVKRSAIGAMAGLGVMGIIYAISEHTWPAQVPNSISLVTAANDLFTDHGPELLMVALASALALIGGASMVRKALELANSEPSSATLDDDVSDTNGAVADQKYVRIDLRNETDIADDNVADEDIPDNDDGGMEVNV